MTRSQKCTLSFEGWTFNILTGSYLLTLVPLTRPNERVKWTHFFSVALKMYSLINGLRSRSEIQRIGSFRRRGEIEREYHERVARILRPKNPRRFLKYRVIKTVSGVKRAIISRWSHIRIHYSKTRFFQVLLQIQFTKDNRRMNFWYTVNGWEIFRGLEEYIQCIGGSLW